MGFGHQRAAHALSHLTEHGVVTAGEHDTNDPDEARFWHRLLVVKRSRTRSLPLVGHALFGADLLLKILLFYLLRDLS